MRVVHECVAREPVKGGDLQGERRVGEGIPGVDSAKSLTQIQAVPAPRVWAPFLPKMPLRRSPKARSRCGRSGVSRRVSGINRGAAGAVLRAGRPGRRTATGLWLLPVTAAGNGADGPAGTARACDPAARRFPGARLCPRYFVPGNLPDSVAHSAATELERPTLENPPACGRAPARLSAGGVQT